jgi:hypothetical protein
MKKMKKALFAVIAAFSLSACDFDIASLPSQIADTVSGWTDSITDLIPGAKKEEEKKEEELPCEHKDANHDGVCDLCGETGIEVKHSDENKDHKCDVCGAVVSEHADSDKDHKCDLCGAVLSEHADNDKDHKCDLCGEKLSEHADEDHDHKCDYCGAEVSQHVDEDKDHFCDECKEKISEHADADKDHLCDLCGEKLSDHADEDGDFKCDFCGKNLDATFEIDLSKAVTEYGLGDKFLSNGVKVLATSETGSTMTVTDLTFSEPDMNTLGEQEVTVSFKINEVEHSVSYKINVSYWSEEDLAVLKEATIPGYYTEEFPYVAGVGMKVAAEYEEDEEREKELVGWEIHADVTSNDEFSHIILTYNNFVSKDIELDGGTNPETGEKVTYEVNFSFVQAEWLDEEDLLEDTGLNNAVAFMVKPSLSLWTSAEYFVMGFDDEMNFIIKDTFAPYDIECLCGMTGEIWDGEDYYSGALYSALVEELPGYFDDEFSEVSAAKFILPELNAYAVSIVSSHSLYPFYEAFKDFDALWGFDVLVSDYEASVLEAYDAALLSAGYSKQSVTGEGGYATTYYFIDNDAAGYMLFSVTDCGEVKTEIGTFEEVYVQFRYIAPEEYTYDVDGLAAEYALVFAEEYERGYFIADTYIYYAFGIIDEMFSSVSFYVDAEGYETGLDLIAAMGYYFNDLGYYSSSPLYYSEADDDYAAYYALDLTDLSEFGVTLYVDEVATEEGYFVEIYTTWDAKYQFSFNEYVGLLLRGSMSGLNGFDFLFDPSEDSFAFIKSFKAEEEQELSLEECAKSDAQLLKALGFEEAESSEEEGVYTVEFKNEAQASQVLVSASFNEDGNVNCVVSVSYHRYLTPESVANKFAAAEGGEGSIKEEEGKYTYGNSISGEFESIEAVANAFAEYLPAGFELVSSEAAVNDDTSWVQVYEYEEAQLKATLVAVTLGEGEYYAYVRFEFIMPEIPTEEIVAMFADNEIEGVVVPNYTVSDVDTEIEIDDSWADYGYYDVYIVGSTAEEMGEYVTDLLYAGWIVVGEDDGDYILEFGYTGAYVNLGVGEGYIGLYFYIDEPYIPVTPGEGMTPEEALTVLGGWFGVDPVEDEDEDGVYYYIYNCYEYDEENDVTALGFKDYVDYIVSEELSEFEVYEDWTQDEDDGSYSLVLINDAYTVVEVYLYEETCYVLDGEIVEEGTEGAEEQLLVFVEAYAY